MAARAAVGMRWMEIAPSERLLCSQSRRNALSGRRLDTIEEERTLSNEELVAGLQSAFDNVCNLGTLMEGQRALGVDHTVRGWELTGRTVSGYRRSNMAFTVGDGLVFKLGGGDADLAQVSMSDYKVCSAEAPKAIYRTNTTEVIYLNRTGNWYFISRVPDHCKSGKKLMITVVANNAMNNNSNNNRAGFIFRGTSPRMRFGGHGTGGGGGGHGNGGASGNVGAGSIPKGHPSRGRSRSSSTPQLSAVDFEFRLVMAAFCSVLLAGPLFV